MTGGLLISWKGIRPARNFRLLQTVDALSVPDFTASQRGADGPERAHDRGSRSPAAGSVQSRRARPTFTGFQSLSSGGTRCKRPPESGIRHPPGFAERRLSGASARPANSISDPCRPRPQVGRAPLAAGPLAGSGHPHSPDRDVAADRRRAGLRGDHPVPAPPGATPVRVDGQVPLLLCVARTAECSLFKRTTTR